MASNKLAKRLLIAATAAAAGFAVRSATRTRYDFRNRSVFITGGSRGLGFVVARILAEQGARLTLVGRHQSSLDAAEVVLRDLAAEVLTIACDIRNRDEASSAVQRAVDYHGGVDVLVNNAGVIQVGPFDLMTLDDFEAAMAIHAWAPLYLIRAVLPHMRARGGGRIVNISSIGGKIAVPHLTPYTVSKFALAGLSDAVRAELAADGIKVTSVFPGLMRTGSHVNANFKGDHEKEFALFSLMDALPVFSINARRAGRQIVEACRNGRAELIITTQAKAAVLFGALFPGLLAAAMKLTSSLLPTASTPEGLECRSGWDSTSAWSPSMLTRLADKAIEENNEYRAA
jgi:short-subunit dehydrogenase